MLQNLSIALLLQVIRALLRDGCRALSDYKKHVISIEQGLGMSGRAKEKSYECSRSHV